MDAVFAVVDLETTGLRARGDRIVEIAVSRMTARGEVLSEYTTLVNPGRDTGPSYIHGVTDRMVADAPTFADVASDVLDSFSGAIVVAHNASFENGFLTSEFQRVGHRLPRMPALCTLRLARRAQLGVHNHRLGTCCQHFRIDLRDAHTALGDVRATRLLMAKLAERAVDDDPGAVFKFTTDVPALPSAGGVSWSKPRPGQMLQGSTVGR
jgi:DNA polymerase III epsilon subunit family exonuclease